MNPILQRLQGTNHNLNNVRAMMNMVRNSRNPQAMIGQMAQSNSQIKQVMDYVQQSGGDPRQAFYRMAQEKGVDPNHILNMLK